jgi:hypothetical protein
MPVDITIGTTPISYPSPGDAPGWGAAATEAMEAVAEVLASLSNPNDILETTFTVANNVSSFSNVLGLAFNTGAVRSAEIAYSIVRTSSTNLTGITEAGTMTAVYDSAAGSGDKWQMSIGPIAGPGAGVTFSVTDAGQVQYKSSDIGATSYVGEMRFRAKTILSA